MRGWTRLDQKFARLGSILEISCININVGFGLIQPDIHPSRKEYKTKSPPDPKISMRYCQEKKASNMEAYSIASFVRPGLIENQYTRKRENILSQKVK